MCICYRSYRNMIRPRDGGSRGRGEEEMLVVIRGAGDIATGIALRLYRAGMQVVMCDLAQPTSIRRTVCFSEAIRLGETTIEGVRGVLCEDAEVARLAAQSACVAVMADPKASCVLDLHPDVLVDAILAKRNLGTTRGMAPVVIGVGPGFTAQVDVDAAVETMRGHTLGRAYYTGSALPNTAIPGLVGGYAGERVLRAPCEGAFRGIATIGDHVEEGQVVAYVDETPVVATLTGVLRGLLADGVQTKAGLKCGDVDPRDDNGYCQLVSDCLLLGEWWRPSCTCPAHSLILQSRKGACNARNRTTHTGCRNHWLRLGTGHRYRK